MHQHITAAGTFARMKPYQLILGLMAQKGIAGALPLAKAANVPKKQPQSHWSETEMRFSTAMKLGQTAGALLLAGGVASCTLQADVRSTAWLFIAGATLYGGCRLSAWLRKPD